MAKPSTATTRISLKLLIDAPGKRVVLAEAGKDFVDFLLRILSLPVANAVGLLGNDGAFGSIANLSGSVKSLKPHILRTAANDAFLKPAENLSFLTPTPEKNKYCSRCGRGDSSDSDDSLDSSSSDDYYRRDRQRSAGEGVVKGLMSYMVTDDLSVTQLTTKSTIDLMKKLGVNTLDALEERVVHLTMAEANKFVKVCMQSKSVFTDYFVKGTNTNTKKKGGPPQEVKVKKERYHPYK